MARYGAEGGDVSAERGDAVRQSSSFPGSDVNKGAPSNSSANPSGAFLRLTTVSSVGERRGEDIHKE